MSGKHRREEGHRHGHKKEQEVPQKAQPKPDEKQVKIERMGAIHAKLDDIHHSQKALLEKVANLQLALLEMPDKELETAIGTVFSNITASSDLVGKSLHDYEIKINVLKQ